MPKQSEIDRRLVLFYRSNNAHGFTNFSRPIDWLDKLPMAGLEEFSRMLSGFKSDVDAEIAKRNKDGMPKYSRAYHNSLT